MKWILGIMAVIALGALFAPMGSSIYKHARLSAFANMCDSKGGVVVRTYAANGQEWLGCYSGLKEIHNIDSK